MTKSSSIVLLFTIYVVFTHAHLWYNLGKMVGHPKIQGANGDIDFRPSQKWKQHGFI